MLQHIKFSNLNSIIIIIWQQLVHFFARFWNTSSKLTISENKNVEISVLLSSDQT